MRHYLTAMRKYAVFRGRASRAEYWCFILVYGLLLVAATILDAAVGTSTRSSGLFVGAVQLAHVLPGLAAFIRRMHDRDRSGWWFCLSFTVVGVVVPIGFSLQRGSVGPNRYGPDPYTRPNVDHVEQMLADVQNEASASSALRDPNGQQQAAQQTVRAEFENCFETAFNDPAHEGSGKMSFDFRNASRPELRRGYRRIAQEIGDDQFFTKRELNHLPRILGEGEQVLAFTSGLMDGHTWLITLTDRRIIFLDKGLVYGLRQSSINLNKINAVSGETGLFFGKIFIEDGASQRVITNVWKKTVTTFTNKVRDALEMPRSSVAGRMRNDVSEGDVVSKLERLALLWDKGMLTEDEFLEQKARIMMK